MGDTIARELIEALYAATPVPAGCRVNHARGILIEGHFKPSAAAAALSSAPVFAQEVAPALVRLSSSSGDPQMAQDNPRADPRGLAVCIGEPAVLVLVGHSIEAFPANDGASFLEFLKIVASSVTRPELLERHLEGHAAARGFVSARPGPPRSFAKATYHMLHPYRLTALGGSDVIGRLSVSAAASVSGRSVETSGPDYLDRELQSRLRAGDVELVMHFHHAPPGVDIAEVSRAWPDTGEAVELGRILLSRVADDQRSQRRLVFDPSVLQPGIAFAGDAMIATRLAAYQLAFQRRLRR